MKHILNGADVMAPGIIKASPGLKEGDMVLVIGSKKPLAIGVVLDGLDEKMAVGKGKVVKNIHYLGDKIWQTVRKIVF